MPASKKNFTSGKGCFLTVILLVTIVFYASMQSIKPINFDETDIMVSSREAYFDSDYVYSEGLTFSFALTAYDGNDEPIEDPSIGVLRPYYRTWGLKEDIVGTSFEPLNERACNKAELHIDDTVTAN